MARPSTRAADHGHTPCKGGRPRTTPLQGRPAVAKAVGPALSLVGVVTSAARVAAPWQGDCRPQGWPPLGKATADRKGPPPCHQRRGSGRVVKAKRARVFFLKR
ncbi:hypothetical protein BHE74_00016608 [Ensete ventricosum]|nr:hypothetical protein BHE74_00016608 [Ensete ventricosum]RZS07218.1 hypothetical protein BHM03_00038018 [Ensete ventricosum]